MIMTVRNFGLVVVLAAFMCVDGIPKAIAQNISGDTTNPARFGSVPTILLRSPDPANLAKFYEALGMRIGRVSPSGAIYFYLDGNVGSLEVLQMHPDAQPDDPKTSRTQQGVVVIFETDDQEEVVRRARAAGSPMIEKWTSSQSPISIYYIADPENNIFGFAPRNHNPNIPTP